MSLIRLLMRCILRSLTAWGSPIAVSSEMAALWEALTPKNTWRLLKQEKTLWSTRMKVIMQPT